MPATEIETEAPAAKPAATSPLEIVVNRDALLAELSIAANVVESKTTIPILANFLITADEKGVTITATDLDRSIVTSVPAEIKNPGAITVPARKLCDYVRLLAAGSNIAVKGLANGWVQIRAGRSNTKMVGMLRTNYPQVPEIGDRPVTTLPVHTLRLLIAQTSFAMSHEESRYTLMGALFGVGPEKLFMVATDGHRLALSEKQDIVAGVKEPFTLLVPSRAIEDIKAIMAVTETENVSFAYDDSTIFFVIGHRQYSSRRLSGKFPNYEAILPRENHNSFTVRVSEAEFAVRRAATFADERSGAVKMTIGEQQNTLTLSAASAGEGESEETVPATFGDGVPAISIGFNSAYLLDFFKSLGGKGEAKFSLKDGQSACSIEPYGGDQETKLLYVVMPMRVA